MKRIISIGLSLLAAACTSVPSGPSASVPDNLVPEASQVKMATLAARGVQIYQCRAKKDEAQATEWAFVAPEADLFDAQGTLVGKHYAGPHWESLDGSKVVGSLKARADVQQPGAIPWLLLATKSDGPAGTFAKVTRIQRINTVAGLAPAAGGCTATTLGQSARVAYSADYVMFGSH